MKTQARMMISALAAFAMAAGITACAAEAELPLPEALKGVSRLDVVGYDNTPWSEAGHPPFTTVAFDLERIVAEVMGVMDRVGGDSPPTETLIHVPPRLVVRGTGQKEFDHGM